MVDLIESIMCNGCPSIGDCDKEYFDECDIVKDDVYEGIRIWLSSFDTASATKCFEAVQILKERLDDDQRDQRK